MRAGSIGMNVADIDTPALCLNIEVVEANIKRMADYFRDSSPDVCWDLFQTRRLRMHTIRLRSVHAGGFDFRRIDVYVFIFTE